MLGKNECVRIHIFILGAELVTTNFGQQEECGDGDLQIALEDIYTYSFAIVMRQ